MRGHHQLPRRFVAPDAGRPASAATPYLIGDAYCDEGRGAGHQGYDDAIRAGRPDSDHAMYQKGVPGPGTLLR